MNAYSERFKQHPLQGALEGLRNAIKRVRIANRADGEVPQPETSLEQRAAFARLIRVATYISNSIKRCDASIWTATALNAAQVAVTTLTNAVELYESSKSVAHFEAEGDSALDQFRTVAIARFSSSTKDAQESFALFCERAEAGLASIEEVHRSIKNKELEITTAKDSFEKQLEDLANQLEAFKAQFESQKARVDELVTAQQQAFQTAQLERANLFTEEAANRKLVLDQWTTRSEGKVQAVIDEVQKVAAVNLEEMDKHRERAAEILGIVAASGVSGHYKETAERDFNSANTYRRWAFVFFVLMAGVITYVVMSVRSDSFRWEMGLFRVGVGMALLIPAYYCAKESAKHREAEKRNRRLQIELATIEPYLEKLNNPEEMRAILKDKANSYFMGQVPREPDDDVEARLSGKEWKRREEQFMEMVKTLGAAMKGGK